MAPHVTDKQQLLAWLQSRILFALHNCRKSPVVTSLPLFLKDSTNEHSFNVTPRTCLSWSPLPKAIKDPFESLDNRNQASRWLSKLWGCQNTLLHPLVIVGRASSRVICPFYTVSTSLPLSTLSVKMHISRQILVSFLALAVAHSDHAQTPIEGPHKSLWYNTIPGDGGTQVLVSISSICSKE